jgi:muramoyltetrapeptide carboxypeptidase LdcA involved in peptidoglycan recycling
MFVKPKRLRSGDTVATISLSGGSAGEEDMHWRYQVAKRRLHDLFGLQAVETPNSQKGRDFIYKHPEARAEDLMQALVNPTIQAVLLNQGGDDGIRTLPFIDLDVLAQNPKVFMGYSDGSVFTSMYQRAGVVSSYGPNVLTTLSEPVELHEYTAKWIRKVLFCTEPVGNVDPAPEWTAEPIDWSSKTEKRRGMTHGDGCQILQGEGRVSGPLLGGCPGPMQLMMGTPLWREPSFWSGAIVFIEGIIPYGIELSGLHALRSLAAAGMFRHAAGVVFARLSEHTEESKRVVTKVLFEEEGLETLPVLMNVDCGHTAPMAIMPFGVTAEIDCERKTSAILDSAVQ